MKYSKSNPPLVCMQTQSSCYKGTSKMTVKGVLWHSTGADNTDIKRYVQPSDNAPDKAKMLEILGKNRYSNDWNHISIDAGLNAWIGHLADGTVATVQSMPWDYRPWGCGSGPKGSCNNGWIQFEICEDDLKDKNYFEAIYKEACELTAYLCKLYNINPKGTVLVNGVNVPTILCHKDSCNLGFGSNHGDVLHWFPKYGKDMDDVRNDVAALMGTAANTPVTPSTPAPAPSPSTGSTSYKVGDKVKLIPTATYADGQDIPDFVINRDIYIRDIYSNGDYVISIVPTGAITGVVKPSMIVGAQVAPTPAPATPSKPAAPAPAPSTPAAPKQFKVGDKVRLIKDAKYADGQDIPDFIVNRDLYIRDIYSNGDYVISIYASGAITGVVKSNMIVGYTSTTTTPSTSGFNSYLVRVTADVLNVRSEPNTNSRITTQIKRNGVYTIVDEKSGWGKLKSGAGWISLNYVEKV